MTSITRYAKPTGDIQVKRLFMGRTAPWYWRLTQRPSFILSYLRGWLATGIAKTSAKLFGFMAGVSELRVKVYQAVEPGGPRVWTDYGVTSRRVVTDAFVALVIDAMDGGASPALDTLNYMAFGSSSAVEAAANTGMTTEFTTQYATDNVRPTGTVTQPLAYQYRIVATFTPDAGVTVNECGPMTQAAVGGGSLLDRSLTGAFALDGAGDAIQVQYTYSLVSGG